MTEALRSFYTESDMFGSSLSHRISVEINRKRSEEHHVKCLDWIADQGWILAVDYVYVWLGNHQYHEITEVYYFRTKAMATMFRLSL